VGKRIGVDSFGASEKKRVDRSQGTGKKEGEVVRGEEMRQKDGDDKTGELHHETQCFKTPAGGENEHG